MKNMGKALIIITLMLVLVGCATKEGFEFPKLETKFCIYDYCEYFFEGDNITIWSVTYIYLNESNSRKIIARTRYFNHTVEIVDLYIEDFNDFIIVPSNFSGIRIEESSGKPISVNIRQTY